MTAVYTPESTPVDELRIDHFAFVPDLTPQQLDRLQQVHDETERLQEALIRAATVRVISWGLAHTVCKDLERSIYAAEHPLDLLARIGWRAAPWAP